MTLQEQELEQGTVLPLPYKERLRRDLRMWSGIYQRALRAGDGEALREAMRHTRRLRAALGLRGNGKASEACALKPKGAQNK